MLVCLEMTKFLSGSIFLAIPIDIVLLCNFCDLQIRLNVIFKILVSFFKRTINIVLIRANTLLKYYECTNTESDSESNFFKK